MKHMEQQNVKYDPQIRKLQKERYADQGNDIAEEHVLVNLFCNTLFDKYLLVTSLHWC